MAKYGNFQERLELTRKTTGHNPDIDVWERDVINEVMNHAREKRAEQVGVNLSPPTVEKGINPVDREAFDLWIEGYTWPQIGEKLGITKDAARAAAKRFAARTGQQLPSRKPGRPKKLPEK